MNPNSASGGRLKNPISSLKTDKTQQQANSMDPAPSTIPGGAALFMDTIIAKRDCARLKI